VEDNLRDMTAGYLLNEVQESGMVYVRIPERSTVMLRYAFLRYAFQKLRELADEKRVDVETVELVPGEGVVMLDPGP
jgi:hypothetical protein